MLATLALLLALSALGALAAPRLMLALRVQLAHRRNARMLAGVQAQVAATMARSRASFGLARMDTAVLDLRTATLDQLVTERQRLLDALENPAADLDVDATATRASEVAQEVQNRNQAAQRAQEARQALLGAAVVRTGNTGTGGGPTGDQGAGGAGEGQRADAPVSYGRAFAASPEVRAYAANNGRGQMRLTVGEGTEVRALFATTNYPSSPTRVPEMVQPNRDQPLTLLDLIDRRPMNSATVEWVQEDTVPAAAAEVAEGATKAESTFSLSLKTDVAATIAHWVNITRQTLQDEAQLQGYVEGRLTYGLLRRVNAQILNGNGTAPNMRGILATTGRGIYTATAAEAAVISVRKAKTVAQLSEYDPDTVAMNPADWERIELSTDGQGSFRVTPNPANAMSPRIWGLIVVTTTALAATVTGTTGGTFVVGGFREGATLWERTGVELFITDSHASNFTSNILTLLAELRAVLSVWRPKAFVHGTFGNAGN